MKESKQSEKKLKLVGTESEKVYFESNERSELLRWLDSEFGGSEPGVRKNLASQRMPEAMRIIGHTKKVEGKMNELIKYGFEYNELLEGLSLLISEKGDISSIQLLIRPDNREQVEIYQFTLKSGLRSISEAAILKNEGGVYTGGKKNYLKFKGDFLTIRVAEEN